MFGAVVRRGGDRVARGASSTMPDFSLPNAQGAPVVFSKVHAKVRVVTFWASWSPYSREELPALVRLKKEFAPNVEVVALDRDTTPADGQAFLASLSLGDELLFAYDAHDAYFKQVGGYNMPETVFVDERGVVRAHIHGPMSYDGMAAEVRTLLGSDS